MNSRNNPKDCLAAALRLLARRDHSRSELSRKLVERGFPQDEIKAAISECLRLDYLDDERYATDFTQLLQRKGYGRHRIRQMLIAKGLTLQVIAACLDVCCPDAMQIRGCRRAMFKKLKGDKRMQDSAEARARLYRFLYSRGFSSSIIRQAMDEEPV